MYRTVAITKYDAMELKQEKKKMKIELSREQLRLITLALYYFIQTEDEGSPWWKQATETENQISELLKTTRIEKIRKEKKDEF